MTKHLLRGALLALLAVQPVAAQPSARYALSADGAAQLDVAGMGTAAITVSGTYTGTVNFEVIGEPGTAAVTVDCATPAAPGTAVNSTTSTGVWTCPVAGLSLLQARMSSYSNGTAVVFLRAVPAGGGGGGGGGSATASLTLQEADDASIASGQSADVTIGLGQVYNGSAWVRQTVGTAGTAAAQVTTIQGVASMTPVQVADNGASLTVDGTVTVTDGAGALNVICDSGCAGGTQYTEDDAAAANPVGGVPILVRADTPGAAVTADGDNVAQRGTNYGAAYVQVVDSSGNFINTFGGSGGTALADDADFTAGTTSFTPVGGFYQSSVTACTDGDTCTAGITAQRTLKVTLYSAAGAELASDTQATHATTLGTITSVTGGVLMGNASTATPTDVGADGDAAALWLTRNGALNIVNRASDGTAWTFNTGTMAAGTPRFTLATDDPVNDALVDLQTRLAPSTGAIIRSDNTNNDDETEIKATPGVLFAVSGRNSSTDTNAFLRCTDLTAANTTPGSSTVFYEMMLPFGGGFVQSNLGPAGRTFSTALTCYLATGEAATDATDPTLDKVVVNVDYR